MCINSIYIFCALVQNKENLSLRHVSATTGLGRCPHSTRCALVSACWLELCHSPCLCHQEKPLAYSKPLRTVVTVQEQPGLQVIHHSATAVRLPAAHFAWMSLVINQVPVMHLSVRHVTELSHTACRILGCRFQDTKPLQVLPGCLHGAAVSVVGI